MGDEAGRAIGEQADFYRGLHPGAFSPWPGQHFDRDSGHFLNYDRIETTVGPAEGRKGAGMDCSICRDLARAFEATLSDYIEARSTACYKVSKRLAAKKNVDIERAKYELEEHRLICVSAVGAHALLPKRDLSSNLRQLAA